MKSLLLCSMSLSEKYLFMIVIAREDEIANGYYLL